MHNNRLHLFWSMKNLPLIILVNLKKLLLAATVIFTSNVVVSQELTSGTEQTETPAVEVDSLAIRDKFDMAPVLAMEERAGVQMGHFQRIKLIQCDLKYPYVRIEESVEDTPSGRNIIREKIMVADHVIVRLRPGTDAKQFAGRNGMSIRRKLILPDVYLMTTPMTLNGVPDAIEKLKNQPEVIFVEADHLAEATGMPMNSPYFAKQWALHNDSDRDIDAPEAWDWTKGSNSVRVAILDSGIWMSHPDLSLNIGSNPGEIANNGVDDDGNGFVDDKFGWDFVNNDADPTDDEGHGTSVAGIIGARGNNGEGGEGVCWQVKMIAVKVMNEDGYAPHSTQAEGIYYAAKLGVDVINLSLGDYEYDEATKLALEEADKKSIVVVCAAGNDGTLNDVWPLYPASYDHPNIISVGASNSTDYLVSNWGMLRVDLAAPGVGCYSTTMPSAQWPMWGYAPSSGTSVATPHVAGVCALVKAANPLLNATQIKNIVLQSVDKIPDLAAKVATGGRLNAFRAVKMALGDPLAPLEVKPESYTVPFNKKLIVKSCAPACEPASVTTGPTILANDTIPVGSAADVKLHSAPSKGGKVLSLKNSGEFEYQPKADFEGQESFEYLVTAGTTSAIGKVTITTLPPSVEDDAYKSSGNFIAVEDGCGVLANDGFGPAGYCEPEITQQPQYGVVIPITKDGVWTGCFTYLRQTNFGTNAIDVFKYRAVFSKCGKQTNEATVELTTNYVPHYQILWQEWISTLKPIEEVGRHIVTSYGNAPVKIAVQMPEGGRVKITNQASHGTVTLSSDNELAYVANRGISGPDKFQVILSDAHTSRVLEITVQNEGIESPQEVLTPTK